MLANPVDKMSAFNLIRPRVILNSVEIKVCFDEAEAPWATITSRIKTA